MTARENLVAAAAVELCEVTKRFGSHVAVDRVSLSIQQGEFFSLLGPSGCGKTTTLRMVAGFVYPDEGEIRIAGRLVNDVPAYRRDTNLVFQQLALFPHLDVFDNIAFGLRVKRKMRRSEINERVRAVLQLVELGGFEARRIRQLSGGQQQRVAIARALINEPAVLLLDEPLGALDLKLRLQMQLELKAIQQRVGITFLFVTHDQGEALTMSDRIAVMNNGRIEQVASSEEIYSHPMTRFVATFIGDTNLFGGTFVGLDGTDVIIDCQGLRVRASECDP
ncbi:MAG: ABC transporter ATP-binding protein, partial [Chloroflexota bacterium]|nr:ABC transporter ATP-binding protein [Chloroflexota bacterium]